MPSHGMEGYRGKPKERGHLGEGVGADQTCCHGDLSLDSTGLKARCLELMEHNCLLEPPRNHSDS